MMTLKRFKVTNFRSIMDSGWITCDNVTSLVGINEAGKSNVILALWKMNPVREGEIDALHDMPNKEYSSWRNTPDKIVFITAEYDLDEDLISRVVKLCGCAPRDAQTVRISRKYDGEYLISFPNYRESIGVAVDAVRSLISDALTKLEDLKEKAKLEAGLKELVEKCLNSISAYIDGKTMLSCADFEEIKALFPSITKKAASSEIYPHFERVKTDLSMQAAKLITVDPASSKDVRDLMCDEMPSFVYYSNYGNLDAQIYLPHAIKLLRGEKVEGINNDAKVRTLKVLFDFVKLNPQEVLELGQDPIRLVKDSYGRQSERKPTDEEIKAAESKKAERTILLNSASNDLTRKFRDWWKQGNYIFRFQADGDYFKIWVSDDKRPEDIELERRSTGLQWFLSFYLVFLVESQEAHKGAVLLLDEAGLSLHPLAQKDLIVFFENLAKTNQIIYTTHSPFLVDTSNIDRTKVVYSDEAGQTVVSSDLRASDDKLNEKSIYAVHAALGLSVSDVLLQGCLPVIVEGPSDQTYLNAMKMHLIRLQKIAPEKELVFLPSGGVRGVAGVVSIIGGKDGSLPVVILDSDQSGQGAYKKLATGLYQGATDKLVALSAIKGWDDCEIEDLIPPTLMRKYLERIFRDVEDEEIMDEIDESKPVVPQIEAFAKKHHVILESGWKVELAVQVKQQLLKKKAAAIPESYLNTWVELFGKLS